METMIQEKKLVKFEAGKKYTLFSIGSMMAMTSKQEIEVKDLDPEGNAIFVDRGKRKRFLLRRESRSYSSAPLKAFKGAVFEGWDQPITCDTDQKGRDNGRGMICRTMRGNACYNFVASPLEIKAWIESSQINPNFDRSAVLAIQDGDEDGSVVFPEDYKGGHAVIDRMLK